MKQKTIILYITVTKKQWEVDLRAVQSSCVDVYSICHLYSLFGFLEFGLRHRTHPTRRAPYVIHNVTYRVGRTPCVWHHVACPCVRYMCVCIWGGARTGVYITIARTRVKCIVCAGARWRILKTSIVHGPCVIINDKLAQGVHPAFVSSQMWCHSRGVRSAIVSWLMANTPGRHAPPLWTRTEGTPLRHSREYIPHSLHKVHGAPYTMNMIMVTQKTLYEQKRTHRVSYQVSFMYTSGMIIW